MKKRSVSPRQFAASTRTYQNAAEGAFQAAVTAAGWKVMKRGWPDFIVHNGISLVAIEVKPDGEKLRRDQEVVMAWLVEHGILCYLWTPSGGFEQIEVIR